MCAYIYIYIERERYVCIYIYIYIDEINNNDDANTYVCVYIYIYIYVDMQYTLGLQPERLQGPPETLPGAQQAARLPAAGHLILYQYHYLLLYYYQCVYYQQQYFPQLANLCDVIVQCSGKDKGGPSKGGFLNNQLFSYTVLYVCNEINGVYKHDVLFMKNNILFRKPPLLGPPLSCAKVCWISAM